MDPEAASVPGPAFLQIDTVNKTRQKVRARLLLRDDADPAELIERLRPVEQQFSQNLRNLQGFAGVFGVPAEKFREDDSLESIAVVQRADFDDIPQPVWDATSGGLDRFEPFGYDLLHFFDSKPPNDTVLIAAIAKRRSQPSSEDEWIDFLMSLNLKEFMAILV